jgi:hypothetical protein
MIACSQTSVLIGGQSNLCCILAGTGTDTRAIADCVVWRTLAVEENIVAALEADLRQRDLLETIAYPVVLGRVRAKQDQRCCPRASALLRRVSRYNEPVSDRTRESGRKRRSATDEIWGRSGANDNDTGAPNRSLAPDLVPISNTR